MAAMEKIKYTENIDKFMLEFENHNTYVGLSGVAMRQIAGRTMPREAMRRLSTLEYLLDSDWMAALRECAPREKMFVEEQSWRQDHSGSDTDGKRKREDKAVTKPRKQKKIYTAEEKAAYKAKKENERRGMGPAPSKKKIVNTDWTTAYQDIKDSIVKERKNAKQCTRCGFDWHTWVECYRPIQVSAIGSQRTFEKKPHKRWQVGSTGLPVVQSDGRRRQSDVCRPRPGRDDAKVVQTTKTRTSPVGLPSTAIGRLLRNN